MEDNKYWWFLLSLDNNLSLSKKWKLLKKGLSPKRILTETTKSSLWENSIKNLENKAEKIINEAKIENIKILTYIDPEYPDSLRNIDYPPLCLYCKGTLSKNFLISIVGTRKATNYGITVTKDITKSLVKNGITIVSGLAIGIDYIAHKTTIENKGATIAIIASGIDIDYPKDHFWLKEEIVKNGGCIITEFPFGFRPNKNTFKIRNRLIAGISAGTIVVETDIKGGAMITAKYAIKYNKEVFAVPGNIYSEKSRGCNFLIKNGAYPLTSYKDILEHYNIQEIFAKQSRLEGLKEDEKKVYKLLINSEKSIEELLHYTGFRLEVLNKILIELELKGYIQKAIGYYKAIY